MISYDDLVQPMMYFKGSLTLDELDVMDPKDCRLGDVYMTSDTQQNFVWAGESWELLGTLDFDSPSVTDDYEVVTNCKNCGAPLDIDNVVKAYTGYLSGFEVCTCEYCKTTQAVLIRKKSY